MEYPRPSVEWGELDIKHNKNYVTNFQLQYHWIVNLKLEEY